MSKPTLTDRYVDAAMRTVPEAQRPDLAAELRGSIDDQVAARIAGGETPESAEHAVLTDLGDPDKLAAGYTERALWLVGPRYYLVWWRLLKLLLWIVPACAVFGVSLGLTISGAPFGEIIGTVWVVLLSVVVHLCFWVTLVFALIERSGKDAPTLAPWTLDQLPEMPEPGARLGDMVASLVYLVLLAGFVLWDVFVGWPVGDGERMPFLDPGLWPWWIAGLFLLLVLEATLAIVVYARGRWTTTLAAVNVGLNIAVTVPVLWLLSAGMLINPEFFPTVIPEDGAEVGGIVAVVLGFVFAGVAVWDSIDAFLKARRAR